MSSTTPRVRRSLEEIYGAWKDPRRRDSDEFKQFETLIRAMRGIQAIPPGEGTPPTWNSFFTLGGYHGQPFRGKGTTDKDIWGGYCNHSNVLFPTWHRAYLHEFERALQSIPGCEDATLPFWDECLYMDNRTLPTTFDYVPEVLITKKIQLSTDSSEGPNPLYSYFLAREINDKAQPDQRYTKPVGYETVRFPLSGLVGTEEARKKTEAWNAQIMASGTPPETTLNENVGAWLTTGPTIANPPTPETGTPSDVTSVFSRYRHCLQAPNYTVFSNTASQNEWNKPPPGAPPRQPTFVMSLESPHNGIHLAVGGFFQIDNYLANPEKYLGANGDMGANEMAGFDPIFFLHHCFIDYAFWRWQVKHKLTTRGSLTVDNTIKSGTTIQPADAGYPLAENPDSTGKPLTMETELHPFRHKDQQNRFYNSNDVTDIAELGYSYGTGSLDPISQPDQAPSLFSPLLGDRGHEVVLKQPILNINRAHYKGSFVIRVFALLDSTTFTGEQKEVEVGREPILSRWNVAGCTNCQDKLEVTPVVAFDQKTMDLLELQGGRGDGQQLPHLRLAIQTLDHVPYHTDYPLKKGFVGAPSWPADGPPEPQIGEPIPL